MRSSVAPAAAVAACEGLNTFVDYGVHDLVLSREDRPDIAACLSLGIGNEAPGRVDVPGGDSDDEEIDACVSQQFAVQQKQKRV